MLKFLGAALSVVALLAVVSARSISFSDRNQDSTDTECYGNCEVQEWDFSQENDYNNYYYDQANYQSNSGNGNYGYGSDYVNGGSGEMEAGWGSGINAGFDESADVDAGVGGYGSRHRGNLINTVLNVPRKLTSDVLGGGLLGGGLLGGGLLGGGLLGGALDGSGRGVLGAGLSSSLRSNIGLGSGLSLGL